MNLKKLFTEGKPLQTKRIFSAAESVTAIQLVAGAELKEHFSQVPSFLICMTGLIAFRAQGREETLGPGDFVHIEPVVKHSLEGREESLLLLIK
ncbi:MAG: cupin domain-containing protein [Cyclobacteriaceae bacterium]